MGEGVHFFDLANWVLDSEPVSVSAQFVGEASALNPNVVVSIGYENGSVANITYISFGHVGRGKEYLELSGNGKTVLVEDYKKIKAYGCKASVNRKDLGDKGQFHAMSEFIAAIQTGALGQGANVIAGLKATAIAEAAVTAAQRKETISLPNFIATKEDVGGS